MVKPRSRFIRDPIHGLIRFDNRDTDHLLLDLINCKEFQRLRRIKQLGFSELVFPGANHNRFAHSIGVMSNAKRFLWRFKSLDSKLVDERAETIVLVAALLHDLGHGPFSHAFEKITHERHERRTGEIILDDQTEIHKTLSNHDQALPNLIAACFPEAADLPPNDRDVAPPIPQILLDIVSSQLDADRFDYLMRDSHASGAEYGRFDSGWLIDHLEMDAKNDCFYLSKKAIHEAEDYIFARYHMYQAVYFHKATRAAEVMLRLLFERCSALLSQGRTDVIEGASIDIIEALSGKQISLDQYLGLDDHVITLFLRAAEQSNDKTIAYLAYGLIHRRLYKSIDVSHDFRRDHRIRDSLRKSAMDHLNTIQDKLPVDASSALEDDKPSDTPYKIYDPDQENPATQIYIEDGDGRTSEIGTISDLVKTLKDKVTLLRYYFPREIREEINGVMNDMIKGGQ